MRITWRDLRSSATFHPQIRHEWNFGVAQESTFLMASVLSNSHFNISYPSVLPHWYPLSVHMLQRQWSPWHSSSSCQTRVCPKNFAVIVPSAWSIFCPFSLYGSDPVLFQVSIQMSLSQRCLLRPPNMWWQHPSSCFCSLSLLPFQFFFMAHIDVLVFVSIQYNPFGQGLCFFYDTPQNLELCLVN